MLIITCMLKNPCLKQVKIRSIYLSCLIILFIFLGLSGCIGENKIIQQQKDNKEKSIQPFQIEDLFIGLDDANVSTFTQTKATDKRDLIEIGPYDKIESSVMIADKPAYLVSKDGLNFVVYDGKEGGKIR